MPNARIRPAAVFVTCPGCHTDIPGKVDRPGGDPLPYWRVEDAPMVRNIWCFRCGKMTTLKAPWHKSGVYPALDVARVAVLAAVIMYGHDLMPFQGETGAIERIQRPTGYQPGGGDAWAVWWQDHKTNERHEIVIIGDLTNGPLVTGAIPEAIRTCLLESGVRVEVTNG